MVRALRIPQVYASLPISPLHAVRLTYTKARPLPVQPSVRATTIAHGDSFLSVASWAPGPSTSAAYDAIDDDRSSSRAEAFHLAGDIAGFASARDEYPAENSDRLYASVTTAAWTTRMASTECVTW